MDVPYTFQKAIAANHQHLAAQQKTGVSPGRPALGTVGAAAAASAAGLAGTTDAIIPANAAPLTFDDLDFHSLSLLQQLRFHFDVQVRNQVAKLETGLRKCKREQEQFSKGLILHRDALTLEAAKMDLETVLNRAKELAESEWGWISTAERSIIQKMAEVRAELVAGAAAGAAAEKAGLALHHARQLKTTRISTERLLADFQKAVQHYRVSPVVAAMQHNNFARNEYMPTVNRIHQAISLTSKALTQTKRAATEIEQRMQTLISMQFVNITTFFGELENVGKEVAVDQTLVNLVRSCLSSNDTGAAAEEQVEESTAKEHIAKGGRISVAGLSGWLATNGCAVSEVLLSAMLRDRFCSLEQPSARLLDGAEMLCGEIVSGGAGAQQLRAPLPGASAVGRSSFKVGNQINGAANTPTQSHDPNFLSVRMDEWILSFLHK